MIQPGTHELKLWKEHAARQQPRDRHGRFMRVRHTAERRRILSKAAELRAAMGLPPLAILDPMKGE